MWYKSYVKMLDVFELKRLAMIKNNIKFLLIILCLFTQIMSAPLSLFITNGTDDIVASHKICVRIQFDKTVKAILSNSIYFSIDSSDISIEKPICLQKPTTHFLPSFKRSKKVFFEPITYELKVSFKSKSVECLQGASLYFYCISIDKTGRTNSIVACKPLTTPIKAAKLSELENVSVTDLVTTLTGMPIKSDFKSLKNYQKIDLARENLVVDKLKDLENFIVSKIYKFDLNSYLMQIYIFIILILCLMLLCRKTVIKFAVLKELGLFLLFNCIICSAFLIKKWVEGYIFYAALAVLLVPISFYYIFGAKTDSIWDKLKSLIGFLLAAAIIPILLKAFLLFKKI